MRLLLPLYAYPLDDPAAWRRVAEPVPGDPPVTVVVNVHDGPGARLDPAYVAVTRRLRDADVPMLGYVDLGYGARDPAEVRRDVAAWRRYPVTGTFFDRVPAGAAGVPGVRDALGLASTAALNFGTRPDPGYATVPATVCTFEGGYRDYLREPAVPDWPNAAHLVYGVPPGLAGTVLDRLRGRVRCGLMTELSLPNPYAGLPGLLR